MMTVVPNFRMAPTEGNIPFLIFHRWAHSAGSVVKRGGSAVGIWPTISVISRICSSNRNRSFDLVSTNRAQTFFPRTFRSTGRCCSFSTDFSPALSISSTAATGASCNSFTALQASWMVGKSRKEEALNLCSSTVRNLISAMKPNVPSEPIIRCCRISMGSEKSTKAFRLYPVVFFILNLWRILSERASFSVT